MSAIAIAQLILAFAQLAPQLIALANQAKATMSSDDQATIDAAIAQFQAAALSDLQSAVTDLDAAAKI